MFKKYTRGSPTTMLGMLTMKILNDNEKSGLGAVGADHRNVLYAGGLMRNRHLVFHRLRRHVRRLAASHSILIDATVALAAGVGGRASRTLGVWQGSAAQQAAELVPKGVSVVAAFHNLSAELLNGDEVIDCDVIVCSDDANAVQLTRTLAAKIPGVRALDGGKLENARILEQITALLIGMNIRHKGHSGIRITGLPSEACK